MEARGQARERGIGPSLGVGYSRLLALAVVLVITAGIFLLRDRIVGLASLGYVGAFLISVAASATIVLPAPGAAVVFALGGVLNPLIVGLAAGLGESLGELTGYLAGSSGRGVMKNRRLYHWVEEWMRRRGSLTLGVLSVIPNPIFDVVGIAAGATGFPLPKFLLVVWCGKTIKSLGIAFAGAWGFRFIEPFLT